MKKTISILGSTGSVGLSTLKIIDIKRKHFKVNLLSADKNFLQICSQIKKYKPNIFIIKNKIVFEKVKKKFRNKKILILNKFEKIKFKNKNDITISAIPGIAGLSPTLLMISFSKKILIANKESVICGWNLIRKKADKYKSKLIPIDSEHFSIYELLKNHKIEEIEKILITASGGPFLNYHPKNLKKVKPSEAIRHPKWKMGKKISVDSSTMMNKILELIEAQNLFGISDKKLDIIVHPECLVHAIIKFKNGLVKFIYHETTMVIPLANAIFDNQLIINDFFKYKSNNVSKTKIKNLTFQKVDKQIFPIIKLKNRVNEFPSTSIIINACNEILVDQFLNKRIPFLSIFKIIMTILNNSNYRKYAIKKPKNINQIYAVDQWARKTTNEIIEKYA